MLELKMLFMHLKQTILNILKMWTFYFFTLITAYEEINFLRCMLISGSYMVVLKYSHRIQLFPIVWFFIWKNLETKTDAKYTISYHQQDFIYNFLNEDISENCFPNSFCFALNAVTCKKSSWVIIIYFQTILNYTLHSRISNACIVSQTKWRGIPSIFYDIIIFSTINE